MTNISRTSSADTLTGTTTNDTINSGNGNDAVDGGAGNDIIDGGNGNDTLLGNIGNDTLIGGNGADIVYGGEGNDTVGSAANLGSGDNGADIIYGDGYNAFTKPARGNIQLLQMSRAVGDDLLYGGNGADTIYGDNGGGDYSGVTGSGNDTIFGGNGKDKIYGEIGNDRLDGGRGEDTLDGGTGNDSIIGGTEADKLSGGTGNDTFVFNATATSSDSRSEESVSEFFHELAEHVAHENAEHHDSDHDDSDHHDSEHESCDDDDEEESDIDVITDFHALRDTGVPADALDKIDLTSLLGATDLNWGGKTPTANGVWFQHGPDGNTYVMADVNGRVSSAELLIRLDGIHELTNNDFLGLKNAAVVIDASDTAGAVTEIADNAAGENADTHSVTGTINFTDTDFNSVHTASFTAQDSGYLGDFVLSPVDDVNTNVGWSFTVNDGALDYLAAGQTLTQKYDISVDDGAGSSALKTVIVTLTGTNDAPIITAENVIGAVTEQDAPSGDLTSSGSISFSDVDLTDVHLVSANGTPLGDTLGSLTAVKDSDTTNSGTGGQLTWTYSVADAAVEYLAAGQTRVESFTISLDDQNGGVITRQIDVTITGTNDAPIITAEDLVGGVTEQGAPSGDLSNSGSISFSDVDLTDVHLVSANGTPLGDTLGSLTAVKDSDTTTNSGAGGQLTWTYSVADAAVEYLAAGQTRVESFTISLDDQNGGVIARQIDVTITGTNDAPIITAEDLVGGVTEQGAPSGDLSNSGSISFSDVDLTDVHLVSANGTPVGDTLGSLTAVKDSDTTNSGAGGQLTWTYSVADAAVEYLAAGQTKVESFAISLDDQNGGVITKQIDVTITGTNDAPVVAVADVTGAVTELEAPVGNITDSGTIAFTDADIADIHTLSAITPSAGALGTLTASVSADTTGTGLGGEVSWNYNVADSAVEYLAAGQTKVETFGFNVLDGQGGSVPRTVSLTVTGTNDAPVVTSEDLVGVVTAVPAIAAAPSPLVFTVQQYLNYQSNSLTALSNYAAIHAANYTVQTNVIDYTDDPAGFAGEIPGSFRWPAAQALNVNGTGGVNDVFFARITADFSVSTADSYTFRTFNDDGVFLRIDNSLVISDTSYHPEIAFSGSIALAPGSHSIELFFFENGGEASLEFSARNSTGAYGLVGASGAGLGGALTQLTNTGTISFNDVDLTDVHLVSATGAPIGSVLGSLTAVKNSDTTGTGTGGQLTWTYSVANSAVVYLAEGQTKVESFNITLNDQHGGVITKQVDVTVTGTNDVPVVAVADVTGVVTELGAPVGNITDSGTIAFTDADFADIHSLSAVTPSVGALGTLVANVSADTTGTGLGGAVSWNYSVAASAIEYLAAGEAKVETFSFNILDGQGGSVARTVSVTVTGTNDAPVVAVADVTGVVTELGAPAGNIADSGTIAFTDADFSDIHSLSAITPSAGALGLLTASVSADTTGSGLGGVVSWDYSVPASAVEYLAAGQTKVETFSFNVLDGHGGSVARTVSVTVTGTNDVPVVAVADVTGAVTELGAPVGNIADSGTIAFTDADSADIHSLSAVTPSAGALGTLTTNVSSDTTGSGLNGVVSWNYNVAASAVEYLAAGQTKVETFGFNVQDGHGGSVSRTVSATITGTNDAPVAVADAGGSISEDGGVNVSFSPIGNAYATGVGREYVITPANYGQAGALWSDSKVSLDNSFTISAELYFGTRDGDGADGFSFIIQNQSKTIIGAAGGGLGYQGIANSVGIEFDTWYNGGNDLWNDHAAFNTNGNLDALGGAIDLGNIEDGAYHAVQIGWNASNHTVTLSYNGAVIGSRVIDIAQFVGGSEAYIGFAGSTGGAYNLQEIRNLNYQSTNNSVVLDVLTNDTDVDTGDKATLKVVSASSAHGATVSFSGVAGAGIEYSPGSAFNYLAAGQTATDTITYVIEDSHGAQSTTTAQITVTGTNDVPVVAVADVTGAVTEMGTPVGNITDSGTIAFTDADFADTHSISAITPSAGALGTLTASVSTDTTGTGLGGAVTWNYNVAASAVEYLAAGQTKVETFSFNVLDGHGGSVPRTVSVTVTGTNDAAVLSTAVLNLAETDAALTTSGTLTISDVDSPATFVAQTNTVGSYGSFSIGTDGAWTYAASSAHNDFAAGTTHTDIFAVASADGTATSVRVNILGTNDAPVVHDDVNALTVTSLDNVIQTNVVNWVDWTSSTPGTTVVGTIDIGNGQTIGVTYSGEYAFTQTNGGTNYYAAPAGTYTSAAVSNGPTGSDIIALSQATQKTLTFSQPVNNLFFAVVSLNGNGYLFDQDFQIMSYGQGYFGTGSATRVALADGRFEVVGNGELHGVLRIDGTVQSLTWTSQSPEYWNGFTVGTYGRAQSASVSGNLLSNDSDPDTADTFTVSAVNGHTIAGNSITLDLASGARVTVNKDGSYLYDEDSAFGSLGLNQTTQDSFQYTVSDGHGATSTAASRITITGTNETPVVATADVIGGVSEAGTPVGNITDSGTIAFTDTDRTDTHSISAITPSAGALGTLTANVSTDTTGSGLGGVVSWNYNVAASAVEYLAAGQTKVETFGFNVQDGHGGSVPRTVSVTVAGTNDAPVSTIQDLTGSVTASPLSHTNTTLASSYLTANHNLTNGLGGTSGFGENSLARFDDSYSGVIDITSLFGASGINFFGHNYTSLYINNNGNITFNGGNSSYSPTSITAGIGGPIIAPFWADVDTRFGNLTASPGFGGHSTGSNLVWYDLDATNGVLTVTWDDVGAYSMGTVPNAFQMQLINEGSGNFDIVFRYENISWTYGSATSSSQPARAGYNAQDGVHYYELPQSGIQTDLLNLPNLLGNTGIAGVDVFNVRAGTVVSSTLTDSGVINFTDADLTDVHVVSVNGTPIGSVLGSLTVVKNSDTTGTGTGGQLTWTYNVANNLVASLAVGQTKVESFNITIDDQHGGLITKQIDVTINGSTLYPAGVAGEPIQLALTDFSDGFRQGAITVTVADLPSGWSLNDGTLLADGNWSVQTENPDSLAVISPADFSGAVMLNITETWTNADGTIGTKAVMDNVEAYAPGSPVFAVSVNDNLTGSTGADVFVVGQPIGNDVIYSFDTAVDKIDLMGFTGFDSFADVQAHLSAVSGNTVLTLADGQTITLADIDETALTSSNFAFNEQVVTNNTGTITIGNGATLPLEGDINNTGTIELNSAGYGATFEIIANGMNLYGAGHVVMTDNTGNVIYGSASNIELTNEDNTISGAGNLGGGQMSLDNHGTIIADGANALIIDTGSNEVVNSGILEATGTGGLVINSAVSNSGLLWAHGGNIIANRVVSDGFVLIDEAGNIEFASASSANVSFGDAAPGSVNILRLSDANEFTGSVAGWNTDDELEITNIDANRAAINYIANSEGTGGILSLTDGTNTANITLIGQYAVDGFQLASNGVGTAVTYL